MLSKKVVLIGGGLFYFLFLLLTPLGLFNDWVPPLSHSGYYSVKTVDGGDDTGYYSYLRSIFFDGDQFREIFQNDINYTLKDRDINAVRLTRLVRNISKQNVNIIVSANLTNIKFRKWMKENVKNYYEIYISASNDTLFYYQLLFFFGHYRY